MGLHHPHSQSWVRMAAPKYPSPPLLLWDAAFGGLVGPPLSSGLACCLAVQVVGHSPPVDLTSAVASLLLKVTRGQRREGQDMGQRSSSEKDRDVALGHLAMSCFCPNNPSSLLQPTEGSKVNSQDCWKSEIILDIMDHHTKSPVTGNTTPL